MRARLYLWCFKALRNTFFDLVSFGRPVKPDDDRVGSSSRPVNNFENDNFTIKNETPFERFEWNHNHIIPQYVSCIRQCFLHYGDVIMDTMASQITSLTIIYSTVYSGADQRKHQSSASLAFVRGIHRGPVNSPHKWPVTQKIFHLMTSSGLEIEKCNLWLGVLRPTSPQGKVLSTSRSVGYWVGPTGRP